MPLTDRQLPVPIARASSLGRALAAALPLLAASLVAVPARAQGGEWGALAISEHSTAYGYSYDYPTQQAAADRALAECGRNARDCRVHTTFRNTCLVVAGSVDGPIGWAWGGRPETRDRRALDQCRQRGAVNCKVVQRVCSGTAGGPRMPAPRNPAPPAEPPPQPAPAPPASSPPASSPPPNPAPIRPAPGAPTPLHRS
jgi:serine/threonine-protein kinase